MSRKRVCLPSALLAGMLCFSACAGDSAPDSSAKESVSASEKEEAAEGSIYTGNDVVVTAGSVQQKDGFCSLEYFIKNTGDSIVHFQVYPLLVNDHLAVTGGTFEDIPSGETITARIEFSTGVMEFAGVESVRSLKGYLVFKDDSYEDITEPELITFLSGEENAEEKITPADNIIYDDNGITITYQGSFADSSDLTYCVFLVRNGSEDSLSVSDDYEAGRKIDGEDEGERIITFEGNTVPAGREGLISLSVRDAGSFLGAEFETADLAVYISSFSLMPLDIPVHLTASDDGIEAEAGEPYDPYADEVTEEAE